MTLTRAVDALAPRSPRCVVKSHGQRFDWNRPRRFNWASAWRRHADITVTTRRLHASVVNRGFRMNDFWQCGHGSRGSIPTMRLLIGNVT